MMVRIGWLLGAGLFLALPLAAQGDTQPAFRDLRARIAATTDREALLAQEQRVIASARLQRDDPALHLELGFLALRLGDLTGHTRRYEDAQEEFDFALTTAPHWWVGHYGRALAILGVRTTQLGIIARVKELAGFDAELAAATALARSAGLDATAAEGLVAFSRSALAERDTRRIGIASMALDQLGGGPAGKLRDVRLVRGVIERVLNRFDVSLAYLTPLWEEFPDDAEIAFEMAETRFVAGRTDGAELWYQSLAGADAALMRRFQRDLVLVMPDTTLDALLAVLPGERVAIATRHWEGQAEGALPVTSERIRDHYRRLHVARSEYLRRDSTLAELPIPGMRAGSDEFDARGVVVVRHGPPPLTTTLSLPGFLRNASWAYPGVRGDTLLFHFVFLAGRGDAVQLESALDLFALSGQARFMSTPLDTMPDGRPVIENYGASLTAQTTRELFLSREPISPIYTRLFDEGRRSASHLQQSERAIGVASMNAAPSWSLNFELPLVADLDVVAAGDGRTGRLIQLAFAIPGSSVTPHVTVQGAFYQVRLRAAIRDGTGAVVARVDTVRVFRTSGVLLPHEMLVGRTAVEIPPGDYQVQAVLETDKKGRVAPPQLVHVAEMTRGALVLSELVLGSRQVPLPVPTATGDTAWVNPTRAFRRGTPMQFYIELGGLAAASKYRVEMTVVHVGSGGFLGTRDRTAITLAFQGVHGGGVSAIVREVALNRLSPGGYRLEVAVIGPDGSRSVRRQEFTVIK